MNNFVQKSAQIKGNLSVQNLKYKPFPLNEFKQTFSKLSIVSVATYTTQLIQPNEPSSVLTISCNFIQSEQINENSQIESYEVPLQTFLIVPGSYQVHNFSVLWFPITYPKDELIFTIKNFENEVVQTNIDVHLTFCFQ